MNTHSSHRIGSALAAAALAALVAGCTVGPDYARPAAKTPAAFSTADAAARPALPAAWWTIYHDATLDRLVPRVAVDNQSLKAAAARMGEARALLAAARGERIPAADIGTFNVGDENHRDVGLGFSWEIDLWGRIRRSVEAQGAAAQASADDLAAATLSLQAQLVQAYFALQEQDAVIAAAGPLVAADRRWVATMRNQHAQGVASADEIARARTHLAAAALQLGDARIARAQVEHAIAVMLGQPPEGFSLAPARADTRVPLIPAGVPSTLLQRRPDIAAAERRMAAASAEIGVRTAERYPSLKLVAGISVSHGLFATPNARIPVYAGGTLRANVARARAGYAESVANYRQTVLDAFREVEDNLVVQHELAATADTQEAAAKASHEAARIAANQYREGVIGIGPLVGAQSAAFDNTNAALRLRRRRLDASVNLVKATGGGWSARTGAAASTAAAAPRVDGPAP